MRTLVYQQHSSIIHQLIMQDPNLEELFSICSEVSVPLMDDYFVSLAGAIVGQQLSGKVADVIYKRVETLFAGEITADKMHRAGFDDLRACGLSARKIEYLQSLASKVSNQEVDFSRMDSLSNQEVIDMLVQIKGIGPWTAEMFLMFSLGREDVFSVLDLGLRNGLQKLYKQELKPSEMVEIAKKWSPYQSVVSHYLWRYNQIHK